MLNIAAYEYHNNKVYMKVIRRQLRDTLDPFDMPEERFPRSLAVDFLNVVSVKMNDSPCPEIQMTVQFCSVLNFYASGSYQQRVGSDPFAMMSQTLVSLCVRAYSYQITTKLMDQYIHFPQTADEMKVSDDELQKHTEYPGAFTFTDGSLIGLAAVSHLVEHFNLCAVRF